MSAALRFAQSAGNSTVGSGGELSESLGELTVPLAQAAGKSAATSSEPSRSHRRVNPLRRRAGTNGFELLMVFKLYSPGKFDMK